MLLVIDNYDSFTYNLVQYLGELGQQIEVRRNDQITLKEIELQLRPEPHRYLARPRNAGWRRSHLESSPALCRAYPDSWCLPGPSGDRPGLWR